VLCAKDAIGGAPFAVINSDDYYGKSAFQVIYDYLKSARDKEKYDYCMVGYELRNTVSDNGSVSRGVCEVEGDHLRAVHETKKIQLYADGTLKDLERERELDPESVVSMNFWGFMPSVFGLLKDYFDYFLRELVGEDLKAECLLPVMVDYEMKMGKLEVSVLNSVDKWFGMTYQEDRLIVAEELKQLHAEGRYPESLRGN
jgi:hypothetical protein